MNKLTYIGGVLTQCDTLYSAFEATSAFASECSLNTGKLVKQIDEDTYIIHRQDSLLDLVNKQRNTLRQEQMKLKKNAEKNKWMIVGTGLLGLILGLILK